MDKSWMKAHITSKTFKDGVNSFIDFARVGAIRGSISCPCLKCCNTKWLDVETVHLHLLSFGFLIGYTTWIFHGEHHIPSQLSQLSNVMGTFSVEVEDDISGLVRDALGKNPLNLNSEDLRETRLDRGTSENPLNLNSEKLENQVVETLCELEQLFPPSFFTIMVHLTIHLISEAKLGGPVHYRWMYPIERYLMTLKSYVRNKAQPEGSIAEGYIKEECLTFCSRYFEGVETLFNRPPRNYEDISGKEMYMLNSGGRKLGKVETIELDNMSLAQAHRYVLLNHHKIQPFRDQFFDEHQSLRSERIDMTTKEKLFVEEFSWWLQQQAPNLERNQCNQEVVSLAMGPNTYVKKYKGFIINGFRFLTKRCEEFRKTQNSGVIVEAEEGSYYGKLTDIIELEYLGKYKVVLFRCDWIDIRPLRGLKKDKYGFPLVNFSRPLVHKGGVLKDDPFIISSQARQVFYIEDPKDVGWSHVIITKPRDTYDMGTNLNTNNDDELYPQCIPYNLPMLDDVNDAPNWHRTDIDIEDQ